MLSKFPASSISASHKQPLCGPNLVLYCHIPAWHLQSTDVPDRSSTKEAQMRAGRPGATSFVHHEDANYSVIKLCLARSMAQSLDENVRKFLRLQGRRLAHYKLPSPFDVTCLTDGSISRYYLKIDCLWHSADGPPVA
jgi:hypothetical protein